MECTAVDYGKELHEFLGEMSPCCSIKLLDDDGNKLFDGYVGEAMDTIPVGLWKINSHCFNNEMLVWVF